MRHAWHVLRILLLVLAPTMLTGCTPAQWAKAIPIIQKVLEYSTDAATILDLIDTQVRPHLKDNPALEQAYTEKMTVAQQALDLAIRATRGIDHLSKDELAAAFAEFKTAYLELRALLEAQGLMTPAGMMRASPDAPTIEVPTPLVVLET